MPNWCENDLRITGPKKELERFKEFAKGKSYSDNEEEILCADKFIPYPEQFRKLDEIAREQDLKRRQEVEALTKGGMNEDKAKEQAWEKFPNVKDGYNQGGYDWCINNWGTKWGFCDVELVEETDFDKKFDCENELFYQFNTAWSPPEPLIIAMGKMFPLLNFDLRYFECGCGFNGMLLVVKGNVEKQESGEYFGDRGG